VALIQLLFPEGQRIAPREKYGWQTFPLAQINAVLRHERLFIDPIATRKASQAITCTEIHGGVEQYGLFELRRRISEVAAT
jgi:hypothetical protein